MIPATRSRTLRRRIPVVIGVPMWMDKLGQQGRSTSYAKVTGWRKRAGYPDTNIVSDSLVIAESAKYAITYRVQFAGAGTSGNTKGARVLVNSTVVDTTASTGTGTANAFRYGAIVVDLVAGDAISLQAIHQTTGSANILDGVDQTFLNVIPLAPAPSNTPIVTESGQRVGTVNLDTVGTWDDQAYGTTIFEIGPTLIRSDGLANRNMNSYRNTTSLGSLEHWARATVVTPPTGTEALGLPLRQASGTATIMQFTSTQWNVRYGSTGGVSDGTILNTGTLPRALIAGDVIWARVTGIVYELWMNDTYIGHYGGIGTTTVDMFSGVSFTHLNGGAIAYWEAGSVAAIVPRFVTQRMVKSGDTSTYWNTTYGSPAVAGSILGWVSDTGSSPSIVSEDRKLVAQGAKTGATVVASLNCRSVSTAIATTVTLYQNGASIGTVSGTLGTTLSVNAITVTGVNIAHGDVFEVRVTSGGANGSGNQLQVVDDAPGSYIEILEPGTHRAMGLTKSGTQAIPSASTWTPVTGYIVDPTYPTTVLSGDAIVATAGAVTISAQISQSQYAVNIQGVRILVNGTVVATGAVQSGPYTVSVSRTMVAGDLITMETYTPFINVSVVAAGTWLRYTPT